MKNRIILFLDIDDVISVGWVKQKLYPWGKHLPFDKKCVNVLNAIYDEINYEIVVSSDWRNSFSLDVLKMIFKEFNVKAEVVDITPNSGGYIPTNLDGGRIEEIETYLKENEDEILAWVSVDDLKLFDLEYFVHCPKWTEGIKQTGIKEKILKIFKKQLNNEA